LRILCLKIGQSLSSTPIGGWPEDEMHKWGSYFGLAPNLRHVYESLETEESCEPLMLEIV